MSCKDRCGFCCSWFLVTVPNGEVEREFYTVRGCRINEVGGGLRVSIFKPCPHLKFDGFLHFCDIYDNRPEACKLGECPKEGQ